MGFLQDVIDRSATFELLWWTKNMSLTHVSCSERVLGVVHSEGLHNPGPVRWPLALCLLAAWIVIFLCMLKGIRSSGKVNQHNVVIVISRKTHTHTHKPVLFCQT